jgi:hypothetical protein
VLVDEMRPRQRLTAAIDAGFIVEREQGLFWPVSEPGRLRQGAEVPKWRRQC